MKDLAYVVARRPHLLPGLVVRRVLTQQRRWQDVRTATALLPVLPVQDGAPPPASWQIQRIEWPKFSPTGVTVVLIGPPGQAPRLVLKLPHTPEGVASLRRQQAVLAALRGAPALEAWCALVAETRAEGMTAGQFYIVETALPGHSALAELDNPARRECLQASAAAAIGALHTRTANDVTLDPARLDRWVDGPLHIISGVVSHLPAAQQYRAALERIRTELYVTLIGRTVATSWIHGDFWPGNLLVDGDGTTVVGIVDWERGGPDELPLHDLLHLLLFTRQQVHKWNEADIVAALTGEIGWTPQEAALLRGAQASLRGDPLEERPMVLLYWLRQMARTLSLLPEYGRNRDYLADHIECVLHCL